MQSACEKKNSPLETHQSVLKLPRTSQKTTRRVADAVAGRDTEFKQVAMDQWEQLWKHIMPKNKRDLMRARET